MEHINTHVDKLVREVLDSCQAGDIGIVLESHFDLSKEDFQLVISQLFEIFPDQNTDIRMCIVHYCTWLGKEQAVPYLNKVLLSEADTGVQRRICWILEQEGDTTSLEALKHIAIHANNESTQICAILAMEFIVKAEGKPSKFLDEVKDYIRETNSERLKIFLE